MTAIELRNLKLTLQDYARTHGRFPTTLTEALSWAGRKQLRNVWGDAVLYVATDPQRVLLVATKRRGDGLADGLILECKIAPARGPNAQ